MEENAEQYTEESSGCSGCGTKFIMFLIVIAIGMGVGFYQSMSKKSKEEEYPLPSAGEFIPEEREHAVPAPAKREYKPKLVQEKEDKYSFNIPEQAGYRHTRIIFENGTKKPVTISFSQDEQFVLPAKGKVMLSTNNNKISFSVLDEQGTRIQEINSPMESGVYVYNHLGAWDYLIERQVYTTMAYMMDEGSSYDMKGMIFFSAGSIDHLFKPFPEEIEISTFGGFGSESRKRLSHLSDEPDPDRSLRTAAGPGGTAICILEVEEDTLIIQDPGKSTRNPETHVYIDNAYEDRVFLYMDSIEITAIEPGNLIHLNIEPGDHVFTVKGTDGIIRDEAKTTGLKNRRTYVWTPEGRRQYMIEYEVYTMFVLDFNTPLPSPSKYCRGLGFFECPVSIVFDPFPDETGIPISRTQVELSRLARGRAGPMHEEVLKDYKKLTAQSKEDLPPEKWESFQAQLPGVSKNTISDLDLWFATALYLKAKGDIDAAIQTCDIMLMFQKNRADVYRLRGLLHVDKKNHSMARSDLSKAVEMDTSLEKELKPLIKKAEEERN